MRGSHGWAEIDEKAKRDLIRAIAWGRATKGPLHAELDLTDRCNVACYFCNQQDVRTKEQISYEHLVALIDELAGTELRSVRLSGGGDPLAHKDVGRVMDHLNRRGVVVDNLTTNGALLTGEIAERLVRYEAREVIFSLNAVDAEDYARMMQVRPAVFDKVVGNIRTLLARRGSGPCPSVVVQFLMDRRNFARLPDMYALGVSLGADRVALGTVLQIPFSRVDPSLPFLPEHGADVRPFLAEVLSADAGRNLLHVDFSVPGWNQMVAEIRAGLGAKPELPAYPTAAAFRDENGHCFFGWYSATIRGTGEMYPCCLLMTPDYKPLGNVSGGSFRKQWNGPGFSRLRVEMRSLFLATDPITYDSSVYRTLRLQCVEPGACFLKNMYFRGDQEFYARLERALRWARRRSRWKRAVMAALGRARRRFKGNATFSG